MKGSFDCVVLNDVLEHSEDPRKMLQEARSFLTNGHGYIVASIPNVRYYLVSLNLLLRGQWTYSSSGVLDRTHLRFFTKSTMLKLFVEQAYDVVQIAPINVAFGRLLRFVPEVAEEFRSPQYVIVARS